MERSQRSEKRKSKKMEHRFIEIKSDFFLEKYKK